ncbi:MAG: helix-hairpin-helix domain-containing protein [Sedimentisphaerales bacterium]|nr:helix-hairpin-helix domain-containing protein [Sedimentisphaerales bacterium]
MYSARQGSVVTPHAMIPGHDAENGLIQSSAFAVAVLACVVLAGVWVPNVPREAPRVVQPVLDEQINPNDAASVSLARLPGIGPTRAAMIVAYRERFARENGRAPAFRRPEDLAVIKGIGPVTVEKMRPWLRFDGFADKNVGDGKRP